MSTPNERIVVDPNIMLGKPVIRGTRIPVYLILELLSSGCSAEEIIDDYPELQREDVLAAIWYASQVTQYEEVGLV
ncbi:MAG: DUF433 domain-containing protein [Candidatus Edwardsbacteria bacterium]